MFIQKISKNQVPFSSLQGDIIKNLLYFDIFDYPLSKIDLMKNSGIPGINMQDLEKGLQYLVHSGLIKEKNNFYFVGPDTLVTRRLAGNKLAEKRLATARKISRFMSYFPFVRGIYLSGSLSKGYMDKDSDIDYFIVVSPGRLWLCRTLLIFFKKTFLLNSRKYFCLNYFVDTQNLSIPDRNIFTAKELSYLLPTYNEELYNKLIKENQWTKEYLPNFYCDRGEIIIYKKIKLKTFIEKLLGGWFGNKLDNFCMTLTETFWRIKFKNITQNKDIRIRCTKHVSKFHPGNFQVKVLERYKQKISAFEKQYKVELT